MEIGDKVKSKTRENVNIFSSNQTQFDLKGTIFIKSGETYARKLV